MGKNLPSLPEIPTSLVGSSLATLLVLYACTYVWSLRIELKKWLIAQTRSANASADALPDIKEKLDDVASTLREVLAQRLHSIDLGVAEVREGVRELLKRGHVP